MALRSFPIPKIWSHYSSGAAGEMGKEPDQVDPKERRQKEITLREDIKNIFNIEEASATNVYQELMTTRRLSECVESRKTDNEVKEWLSATATAPPSRLRMPASYLLPSYPSPVV